MELRWPQMTRMTAKKGRLFKKKIVLRFETQEDTLIFWDALLNLQVLSKEDD